MSQGWGGVVPWEQSSRLILVLLSVQVDYDIGRRFVNSQLMVRKEWNNVVELVVLIIISG